MILGPTPALNSVRDDITGHNLDYGHEICIGWHLRHVVLILVMSVIRLLCASQSTDVGISFFCFSTILVWPTLLQHSKLL